MSLYKFGNFEIEFDPTDVAFVEKYEAAAENYQKKIKDISTGEKASETMKAVCEIFFETFDGIFGDGTSEKMFGKTKSVELCLNAFKLLMDIMNDYKETLKNLMQNTVNRTEKRSRRKA